MGILSYFGKQSYTLYKVYRSEEFCDRYDPEKVLTIEFASMHIYINPYQGFGKDFVQGNFEEIIKVDNDEFELMKIGKQFNDSQEKYIDEKLLKYFGDINCVKGWTPFPINIDPYINRK